LTKKDLITEEKIKAIKKIFDKIGKRVFVISAESGEGVKELRDTLVQHLKGG
jgi:ethanolamine utilization protein EutP (predicted NTPase)